MIPADELAHWKQVAEEHAAGLPDLRPVPPDQAPADPDLHRRLCDEAARMREHCPTIWAELVEGPLTRPRPHAPMLMSPSIAMDFGQSAAYQMGQQSICELLKLWSEDDHPPMEDMA